jgi:hypothetical protein
MTFQEQQEYFKESYKQACYAYWNALLVINGTFISVFSALAMFGKGDFWLTFFLVLFSVVSSLLLIRNFKSIKNLYQLLGEMDELPSLKEQTKLDDAMVRDRKQTRINEYIIEGLLCLQVFLIFSILHMMRIS